MARTRGDSATDRQKVREFHFAVYAAAAQPTLLRLIEGLWLQTGPYMNLLYPDFISSSRGPAGRQRLIAALEAGDAAAARREMQNDIRRALSYVAGLADENGNIAPAIPATAEKRRRPSDSAPVFDLQLN